MSFLAKKLALTCRSEREDREAETEVEKLEQEIENDDDEFLKEYMKKRMQEMVEASVINRYFYMILLIFYSYFITV